MDCPSAANPRAVDECIEPSELRHGSIDGGLNLFGPARVGAHRVSSKLLCQGLQPLSAAAH